MMHEPTTATDDTFGESALLFARVLNGKGGGRPIDWEELQQWQPAHEDEVLWMHLRRSAPGVYGWLQAVMGVTEPTAELLTSDSTRPRAFREGDTLVATLRGINFNPGAEPEDMVSMQFWCDGKRLVSSSVDLTLKSWSLPGLQPLEAFAGQPELTSALAFSDAENLVAARMDGSLGEIRLKAREVAEGPAGESVGSVRSDQSVRFPISKFSCPTLSP